MTPCSQAPAELETIADFIRWAASRFTEAGLHFGHGTDNAIDEAAALVLHSLHLPLDLHTAYWPCRLTMAERQAVVAQIRRRVDERLPIALLTREAWFAGLSFYVDERVLVPRSPIAELIETGFSPWLDSAAVRHVVDVGTGSGCIAIACAYVFPEAQIDAVDTSDDALAVARHNIERHDVGGRVRAIHSDLLAGLPHERRYELIVSNPPYVDAPAMEALPAEYRSEPRQALAGGEDGLDFVRPLLRQAAERLTENGVLICEVGHSRAALEAAFPTLGSIWVELERGGEGVFVVNAARLRREFAP